MSISIAFNMPILAIESFNIRCVKKRFFIAISSTWLCEEVGRK
jgi:hypothetical protein